MFIRTVGKTQRACSATFKKQLILLVGFLMTNSSARYERLLTAENLLNTSYEPRPYSEPTFEEVGLGVRCWAAPTLYALVLRRELSP